MTTYDASWSNRWRKISELELPDHYYLNDQHSCAFFGEYTSRQGWSHSSTNRVISNLKKTPDKRGTAEWAHKVQAIERIGKLIRTNISQQYIEQITVVPAPPSKPPTHPSFDDRMLSVARAMGSDFDVRPLLETTNERPPAHAADTRPGPQALADGIRINEKQLRRPCAPTIMLLDDVLVSGATLVACSQVLSQRIPSIQIIGVFVARRVPQKWQPTDECSE